MSYSESDRIAHLAHIARLERKIEIDAWLKANPEVGVLNSQCGGQIYYVNVKGEQVIVLAPIDQAPLAQIAANDAMRDSGFHKIEWADRPSAEAVFLDWFRAGCNGDQALVFAKCAVCQYIMKVG